MAKRMLFPFQILELYLLTITLGTLGNMVDQVGKITKQPCDKSCTCP
jgi:hypothetical protein